MYNGVEFYQDDNFSSSLKNHPQKHPGLIGLITRLKLAKDESRANFLLIIITVISIISAIMIPIILGNINSLQNIQEILPAEF